MADIAAPDVTTPAKVADKVVTKSKAKAEVLPDKVHTWPYLVRLEMLVATFVMTGITIWSIVIDAPLEEPANPTRTPNPSKAPWYFLGLQEMLVYFDPWYAGVVAPSLIIVGLMVIPYIDVNPKGNGYYCFRDRAFAISTFLFGFLVLWIVLIVMGTFLRGPGWYFFWPWQYWDIHKTQALTNVDFPYALGVRSELMSMLVGGGSILLFMAVIPAAIWAWGKRRVPTFQKLGLVRYAITSFLFMAMMGMVVKAVLRIAFNIKYIFASPWFNI